MRKYFILLFFFVCVTAAAVHAQEEPFTHTDSSLLKEDISEENAGSDMPGDTLAHINEKDIAWDSVAALRRLPEFGYVSYLDSLLKNEQRKKDKPLVTSERIGFWFGLLSSPWLKMFLYALAVFFICFIIYHVFLKNFLFSRGNMKLAQAAGEDEESLQGDFSSLAANAKAEGNYRMALRFWYLLTIESLSQAEYLTYDVTRTNAEYAREIPPHLSIGFKELLRIYERAWYGNMNISAGVYENYESKFKDFLIRFNS
ncbi:MAG: DUF4129 domain-containing protein [Ferruginibacter sp.]